VDTGSRPHLGVLQALAIPQDGDGVVYSASSDSLSLSMYLTSREGRVRKIAGLNNTIWSPSNTVGEVLNNRIAVNVSIRITFTS